MNRLFLASIALAALLSGCATNDGAPSFLNTVVTTVQESDTAKGALIGAAAGCGIGAVTRSSGTFLSTAHGIACLGGAAIGGAVGAALGFILGEDGEDEVTDSAAQNTVQKEEHGE